jgi:hypothetical protein
LGVDISSGRLSQFITDELDVFHDEKDRLLQTGLSVSQYVHADDTGARHNGKNGYCTHIGKAPIELFTGTQLTGIWLDRLFETIDQSDPNFFGG